MEERNMFAKKMSIKKTKEYKEKPSDVFYTPKPVALRMIEMCGDLEGAKVLDPCKGGGIFYENLPDSCEKFYCEITEGKDFFSFTDKVDWVIGNPPYSLWDRWIDHTVKITNRFCYIMNCLNLTHTRINRLKELGFGITHLEVVKVDWWFGQHFMIIFEKDKPGLVHGFKRVLCDVCGEACMRGRNGNSPNECVPKVKKEKKTKALESPSGSEKI